MAHILLVEDEPDIAWLVQRQLEKAGHQVSVAHDGWTGLERFYQSGADLVLLDVNLPGITGWETYDRIRTRSRVPVIILTAYGAEHMALSNPPGGDYSYLGKPFSTRELLEKIGDVLSSRPGGAWAGTLPDPVEGRGADIPSTSSGNVDGSTELAGRLLT